MASNTRQLVKLWIQFLKNNRIVDAQADPKSGKLKYNRSVTATDIEHFLKVNTDYDDAIIGKAIRSAKSGSSKAASTPQIKNDPTQQGSDQQQALPNNQRQLSGPANSAPTPKKKKYNTDNAQDVDYRDINEALTDDPGGEFDEDEIERIFSALASQPGNKEASGRQSARKSNGPQHQDSAEDPEAQERNFNEIKRVVRDTMTPQQRKSFCRLLKDPGTVSESQITNVDAKEVLKTAAEIRNKKGIRNALSSRKKVTADDLMNAWVANRKPDDTRDIASLLKSEFEFSDSEIEKAFSAVFGKEKDSDSHAEPVATKPLMKIANYVKSNGLTDDMIKFLEREYGEELGTSKRSFGSKLKQKAGKFLNQKVFEEDIAEVFDVIVKESTMSRRHMEQTSLGRSKK